jgi:glycine dehydrogenase subunit 1
MEVANASLYDGSTAFAEAVLMAKRIYPQRKNVLISKALHPEYKKVAITSTNQFGLEFLEINTLSSGKTDLRALSTALDNDTLAVCLQSPNFFGVVEDLSELSKILKPINLPPLSVVVIAEAMSLALYEPPGSFDVDIVCGETQSFGNYPGFGGPGVGFFTTKEKYVRNMPGRVVGQTLDGQGKIAFCLTLATREQHIRREKATSNICTNQGWCALRSTIYLSTMGSTGLREAAEICYSNAHYAAEKLCGVRNIKLAFAGDFFNEFVIEISDLNNRFQNALNKGIVPGIPLSRFGANPNQLLVTTTELHTKQNLDDLVESLGE